MGFRFQFIKPRVLKEEWRAYNMLNISAAQNVCTEKENAELETKQKLDEKFIA